MENNFEERRKEIDLSNIDIDSELFQRKKLELDAKYASKKETEESFYNKELELANQYQDEIARRTKVIAIESDFAARMSRLKSEYLNDLKELNEKYASRYSKPYYFYWMYIGDIGKYDKIMGAVSYYVKLDEYDNLYVYYDAKYSNLVNQIKYIPEEWRESKSEAF